MFRSRLVFALCISLFLIGGATWYRFVHASPDKTPEIVAINHASVQDTVPATQGASISSSEGSSNTLSTTDLLGRQLLSDYLGIAVNGQITDQNIATLADKYAETISSYNASAPIEIGEIKTVPDTKANFQVYDTGLTQIYTKYRALAQSLVKKSGDLSDLNSPAFASTMNSLSLLYKRSGEEFKALPVPQSLGDLHLKLIQNQFSSADTFSKLANIQKDSTGAFGALGIQATNGQEESALLIKIQGILVQNGVYSSYNGL